MEQPICVNEQNRIKPFAYLLCGALSGMIAQTSSYPLEVIRRQMQVSGVRGIHLNTYQTARAILAHKGFRGLWVGLGIGYLKVTPMFAVSFFTYEYLKRVMDIS
jgi:solute carrier family 25 protein 16